MIGGLLRRFSPAPRPDLVWEPVYLRAPDHSDYRAWHAAMSEGRGYLQPWQPRWPSDHLTEAAFTRRLILYEAQRERGSGFAWHVRTVQDDRFVGTCRLAPVYYGSARSGTLGYWIAQEEAGQGFATAAVRAACAYAFGRLALERIEASCLPENDASIRVLEKAGFRREGLARAYLEIDGRRRDHALYARLRSDPVSAA